jgi:hypothetical protein
MEQQNDIIQDLPKLKKLASEILPKLEGLTFVYAYKVLDLAKMQIADLHGEAVFNNSQTLNQKVE